MMIMFKKKKSDDNVSEEGAGGISLGLSPWCWLGRNPHPTTYGKELLPLLAPFLWSHLSLQPPRLFFILDCDGKVVCVLT